MKHVKRAIQYVKRHLTHVALLARDETRVKSAIKHVKRAIQNVTKHRTHVTFLR